MNTNDDILDGVSGSQAENPAMPRLAAWVKPTLERLSLKNALSNASGASDATMGSSS